jgi:predicted nucleotidyltransferase
LWNPRWSRRNEHGLRVAHAARPGKIILFGSAGRGEMGPDSDVNLLVIKGGRYDRWRLTTAIRAVTEHVHFGSGPFCALC